jgi:DNA-binding IclR family transcriptional regulator
MTSPTLSLALRELAQQARRDPAGTYDTLCELTQAMAAPSSDPYAKAAATLAVGIMRAREDYARCADDIAEVLAEAAREPELPLGAAA